MKLPLYEEVREARRLAEEADAATRLHHEAGPTLIALSVLGRRLEAGDRSDPELPGDALIEAAIERFPHLAPLRDIAPRPDARPTERLGARRQQLLALQQMLAPIASQQETRAHRIHQLQHQQHHYLLAPEFAELRAGIEARNEERHQLQLKLGDLRNRASALGPIQHDLEQYLPDEADLLADGSAAAHARILAVARLLGPMLAALGLPDVTPDDATLDATDAEALRAADALLRSRLRELAEENARIASEIALLTQEFELATRWILDRTG
jgi:hypothetical protein